MARNKPKKGQDVGEWSARRYNYLAEKVAERVTGKPRDRRKIASLDERLELEPDARAAYEFYNDTTIELVGFVDHPRIPFAGCSPDGLVGADGGVEIKCCDSPAHIETITAAAIDPDYLYQIHFNMACTERLWWDFVAFNPEMPEEGKLWVKRIERDDIMIAKIEKEVIEFLAEVDQKVEQVMATLKGSTPLEAALSESLAQFNVVH
jgi:hypothetical protein